MTEKAARSQLNTNLQHHYPSAPALKKNFSPPPPKLGLAEEKNPLSHNGSPTWGEHWLQKSGGSFLTRSALLQRLWEAFWLLGEESSQG